MAPTTNQTADIDGTIDGEISAGRYVDLAYPPGAVLTADHVIFTHYGIAGDRLIDGQQSVISCSWRRGTTCEEKIGDFANGQDILFLGHLGNRSGHDILIAARAEIGRPWHLITNNCEHHVSRASGLKPRSPQLRRAATRVATVAAIALVPALRGALLRRVVTGA